MKVLVLGGTGMLGSAVLRETRMSQSDVLFTSRDGGLQFVAGQDSAGDLFDRAGIGSGDYIFNAVGVTKTHIDPQSIVSKIESTYVNTIFPLELAAIAEERNIRVIQIATDCVFSGLKGCYSENDRHDALDVYGKTKSLGEAPSAQVMNLRSSLIGPEERRNTLLFEWLRTQPRGGVVEGYTNHFWNGVTSQVAGRIVAGIIQNDTFVPGTHHLVPQNFVSKATLLRLLLVSMCREDIEVVDKQHEDSVDRTLATVNQKLNHRLFSGAGFMEPPSIEMMVEELRDWIRTGRS